MTAVADMHTNNSNGRKRSGPASARHYEMASEQAYIDRAYQRLDAMKDGAILLAEAGGDPKAAAALRRLGERLMENYADDWSGLCIGRIDEESGRTLYVGRMLVHDEATRPLVISWAAPAATPFHSASSSDPKGLTLRRTFKTNGSQLLDIYDLVFGEGAELAPVSDALLDAIRRERGPEMRD